MANVVGAVLTAASVTGSVSAVRIDGYTITLDTTSSGYKMTAVKGTDTQTLEWADGVKGDKGDKGDTGNGVDPVLQKPFNVLNGVNVLKLSNGYGVDVNATDYMIPVTGEVYVDVATGDDANAGTESAPLKSITAALAKDANTIYVAEGVYDGENGFNGTTVSKAVNIIGSGKVVCRLNAPMTMTTAFVNDGGVAKVTFSEKTDNITVLDTKRGDSPVPCKYIGRTLDLLNEFKASAQVGFVSLASSIWIRASDGRDLIGKTAGDCGLMAFKRNINTKNVIFTKSAYLRNIAFELGYTVEFNSADGYLCADGCRFDCSEKTNGLSVVAATGVYVFDSCANANHLDGFSYHVNSGSAYEVLEVRTKAFDNGITDTDVAVSDNGSTFHQYVSGIRVGCEYGRNYGGNIADKGNTKAWCVGCYSHDSKVTKTDTGRDTAYNADYWIETNAVMYCHDCKSGGSTYDGWAYDGSAMYLSDTAFKSTYVNASTVAAYHQYAVDVSALNNSVAALQSGKQDVISDLASIRAKANSAVQTETDPTVPGWAKAESKPTYQANEIAMGDSTVGAELSELNEEIAELGQLKPETAPSAVGQKLEVLSINADGTFTCKWADSVSGVSDVKVGANSVVTDGVATIPNATASSTGVMKPGGGLYARSNGEIIVDYTMPGQIDRRQPKTSGGLTGENLQPVTLGYFDYAVKAALTDDKGAAYTTTEQANARKRIGLCGDWKEVGTIAGTADDRGNIDTGLTDIGSIMAGCTELYIYGWANATSNCSIQANFGALLYACFGASKKSASGYFITTPMGFTCISSCYAGTTDAISMTAVTSGTTRVDGVHIADATSISFNAPAAITSCNVKIYAR